MELYLIFDAGAKGIKVTEQNWLHILNVLAVGRPGMPVLRDERTGMPAGGLAVLVGRFCRQAGVGLGR